MPDPAQIPETGGIGDISTLLDLLTKAFGQNATTTTTEGSDAGNAAIAQFLPIIQQMIGGSDFSSAAAERDSAPAVQELIRQMMQNGLVPIAQGEGSAGAYNSTTSTLLKNDLATQAAAKGAALTSATKTQYAGASASQMAIMLKVIDAITNANKTKTTKTSTEGALQNPATQKAAAIAAALAALKKAQQGGGKKGKDPAAGASGKGKGEQLSSDADTLNAQAERLGYGKSGDRDSFEEVLSGKGIKEETSEDLAARSGIDADAIQNRIDNPSDPDYDPYDLQGPQGEGIDFGQPMEPFEPLDLGNLELPEFPDIDFGDDSQDDPDFEYEYIPPDGQDITGGEGNDGGDTVDDGSGDGDFFYDD